MFERHSKRPFDICVFLLKLGDAPIFIVPVFAQAHEVVAAGLAEPHERNFVLNHIEISNKPLVGRRRGVPFSNFCPVRAVNSERPVALLILQHGKVLREIPSCKECRTASNRTNQIRRDRLGMGLADGQQIQLMTIFGIHRYMVFLGKKGGV